MQRFTSTPDAMKRALGSLPTGVTVISFADGEDRPVGMTANAVCSVSLTPPLVLACLNRSSRAWAMIERRGRFGINILGEGQRAIAEHCARPGQDKRLDPRWLERGLEPGAPAALAGALGYLDCAVDAAHPAGTHAIVVGRVRGILVEDGGGAPLAYFLGAYRQLDPSPESRAEAAWDLLARHGY